MTQHKSAWVTVSLTEIVQGDPVRIWSEHEKDRAKLACRFKAGELVSGDARACPAPEFLLIKSLAPGCVRAIKEELGKRGLGSPWPPGCDYN